MHETFDESVQLLLLFELYLSLDLSVLIVRPGCIGIFRGSVQVLEDFHA